MTPLTPSASPPDVLAHSNENDFDDTDTPQIPAEPETPEEENPPGLPDPTEVGEDG